MNKVNYEEIRKKIHSCDMLLIGIGQEFEEGQAKKGGTAGDDGAAGFLFKRIELFCLVKQ